MHILVSERRLQGIMRLIAFFILFIHCQFCLAQQYRFHLYRVEQGLPSDVVKAVTEDSLGFIWCATDDGLVKYDGIRFTTYKNALRSQYAKGFLHTHDGRLLAFSDLDLVEIKNEIDTVFFKTVIKGERYPSDSTLWYPKSIYEDANKQIWLGEPKSVLRFDGKKVKRYEFPEETRSPVFVRSFSFFEDSEGFLYTIAFNGKVFRFDPVNDKFTGLDFQLPEEISHVLFFRDRLLIAARQGLFSATVENGLIRQVTNIFPIRSVSHLQLSADSTILVSTYLQDFYKVKLDNGLEFENLYYNFNGINNCYESRDNDLWISTDKGIVRVQKNIFLLADLSSQGQFIEGIARDEVNNKMYYANKEALVELSQRSDGDWERLVLNDEPSNYFQALQFGKHGLWASTGWKVLLFRDGRILRTWDFSTKGNFVHDLTLDREQNLWICQAGNSDVKMIDSQLELHSFRVEDVGKNDVNSVKEGKNGLYAVANGVDSYVFLKVEGDSVFRNISVPLAFDVRGDFNVAQCTIQNDVIWLATSEGLLRCDGKTTVRVNLGEDFERFPVSCVETLDEKYILFSNSFGLFRYDTQSGDYWLYDELVGLPSNTITNHGIFVAGDGTIWVGTSYGLAFAAADIKESKPTPAPYCVQARINGTLKPFMNGLTVPHNAFVNLQFSSISFPENKIIYQWSLDEGPWTPTPDGQINISSAAQGIHEIRVRAKKNTGLSWSMPTSLTITVDVPYWKKTEAVFLVILLVILIAWASYAISSTIMNQRKKYLQDQINARTQELKIANEELTLRNTELDRFVYSASHDLSAPLKSILGLISVAKLDKPGEMHLRYLLMMERSVYKLEDFIQEVVTYSRNTRMPVKFERFNFKGFVEGLLQDHQYSPNFQHISFRIEDHTKGEIVSDPTRMKIILNNLLSNAIKFHWVENERQPYVTIALVENSDQYVLSVEDNGRGIQEEHIKRVFEMFYRATEESQGSGLGLYILKETVTKLGGTVEATSKLEEGSKFTIRLPIPKF